jgi:hypothetical protein
VESLVFSSDGRRVTSREGRRETQLRVRPAAGGEARPVTGLAGGFSGVVAAAFESDTIVVAFDLLPRGNDLDSEGAQQARRAERKVAAILHEGRALLLRSRLRPYLAPLARRGYLRATATPPPEASARTLRGQRRAGTHLRGKHLNHRLAAARDRLRTLHARIDRRRDEHPGDCSTSLASTSNRRCGRRRNKHGTPPERVQRT